jgi:ornithine carbamoyltransferase
MQEEHRLWQQSKPPSHFISVTDLSADGARAVLRLAQKMKAMTQRGEELCHFPHPAAVAMIFEKPSLRTRVTFEVGLFQLGAHAVYLTQQDIQMGKREAVMDVARNLGRWVQAIVARVYHHQVLYELADYAGVPVINALSDLEHPCQSLADHMTIRERKGEGRLQLAWVGDGNNVCHSYLLLGVMLGHQMRVATPEEYEPEPEILTQAKRIGAETGGTLLLTHDPVEAVAGVDAVYTDIWVSMGYETEREIRMRTFSEFQLNSKLLAHAKPDAIVLHCLPARRGEEITDEVLDGSQSAAWDEAENRLHTQKALLAFMLGQGSVGGNS